MNFEEIPRSRSFVLGLAIAAAAIAVGFYTKDNPETALIIAGLGGLVGGLLVAAGMRSTAWDDIASAIQDMLNGASPRRPLSLPEEARGTFDRLEQLSNRLSALQRNTEGAGASATSVSVGGASDDEADLQRKVKALQTELEETRRRHRRALCDADLGTRGRHCRGARLRATPHSSGRGTSCAPPRCD